jgi:hypothetical protein
LQCLQITYKLPRMQKHILLFTMLLASAGIFAQDYRSGSNPYYWKNRKPYEGYWQQDVAYKIRAMLIDTADVVDATEELTYYNNSPDTLRVVYFHLYQNAFVKGGYLESLNRANNFYQKFGRYESNGQGTAIESISVNGIALSPTIDFSIMKVELKEPLLPGASVTFNIKFKTYFDDGGNQRRRMKLFDAYGNKHYDGVHWYPRICVYDRKFGWETDQHLGKEFYGDFGSYDVELSFPKHFVLDATGELQNKAEVLPADLREKLDIKNFKNKPLNEKPSVIIPNDGTYKTWKFKAINTHDFAWTADPTYRIGEVNITLPNGKNVQCIALAQEPHASRWQDGASFAAKVIEVYSRDFGLYAYPKMIVADARDGMEYPMLTLDGGLSPGYYGLLAHEIGHNWFFGMVGNNETYRASLDEGFTQFLTHWSMSRLTPEQPAPGKGFFGKAYKALPQIDQTIYWGYLRDAINKTDMPLNTHSDDFNGALHHGGGYGHVYYKTATMLYNLQYVLGDELFLAAMQHYFDQWKMCHPYFEDFRGSIINYTHVDLNWFFDQWLETTKTIDYDVQCIRKVRKAENAPANTERYAVHFKRKGEMQMPVDFTVTTKDSSYSFIIPNTYFAKKTGATVLPVWKGWGMLNERHTAYIDLPKGSRISNVQIDPTYRLADVNQLNNSTDCPVKWSFDNQVKSNPNRRYYSMKWRPELWYNSIDGVKAGLHFNGNYMQYKHLLRATVWYNTRLGNDTTIGPANPVNYSFSYTNNVARNFSYYLQSRFLDGLWMNRIGINKLYGNNIFSAYFKSMYRTKPGDLAYLLYPSAWQNDMWNNTLNIEYTRNYHYKYGNGQIVLGMRNTAPGSDYSYATIHLTVINENRLGRLDFRTRVFAQYMTGDNVAPESMLNVAGANSEQMMENKFVRSRAFVPVTWLGYGDDVNHFHFGGGLNIRGFAGYALPVTADGTQVFLYQGMSGASFNGELDLDRLVKIEPRALRNWLHLDVYLFGDAGVIQNKFKAGEYGLTKTQTVTGNVLMSAGTGVALTIKKWSRFDELKPLTLRFDVPWVLNKTPFVDGEHVRFRWIVGVSRAF